MHTNPTTEEVEALAKAAESEATRIHEWSGLNTQIKPREDVQSRIATALRMLDAERLELRTKVYVPGLWRCAKCNFELIEANINATDGTITARDTSGDKCPNCDSPLWRVTERERHHAVMDDSERWWREAYDAKAAVQFALDHPPELSGTNGGAGDELGWAAAIGAYQDMLRALLPAAPEPKS